MDINKIQTVEDIDEQLAVALFKTEEDTSQTVKVLRDICTPSQINAQVTSAYQGEQA